jgi:AraC family ethanolamine operon transcriptional activator
MEIQQLPSPATCKRTGIRLYCSIAITEYPPGTGMDSAISDLPGTLDENALYSLVRRETRDADEQAACLRDWDQVYEQLSPGQFEGRFMEIWFRGIQLFREVTNQSVHEEGLMREGERVLGVPVEVLTRYTREIEHRDIEQELQDVAVVQATKAAVDEFRGFLLTALESVSRTPAMLQYPAMQKGLEHALLSSVVKAVGHTDDARTTASPTARHAIVSRAQDYMREHVEEPLTVEDLCRVLGVSRRTLQYSFQEVLQLNPVSYLRAMRLNGVRRMLKTADPQRHSVQDIAARWGFWHLSHFANDYRRMFGELPSETLRGSAHPARLV